MNERTDPRAPGNVTLPVAGLHLLGLCAVAFAQPLFDLLAQSPEFFVARGNTGGDILILAFVVLLAPPLLLLALEAAIGRFRPKARRILHLVLVAMLVAIIALPLIARVLPDVSALLIPLALALAAGAAVAYARVAGVRSFATVLSPFALVFLVSFLVISPVSQLVFGSTEAGASDVKLRSKAPVVMLVLDELPTSSLMNGRGEIAKRVPAFREFARDATWYRNATTVNDSTLRSVPGMLSGRPGGSGEPPIAANYPRNLFTILGDAGYDLSVDEPLTDLCPERLCGEQDRPPRGERLSSLATDLSLVLQHLVLPADLREDLDPIDRTFEGFGQQDEIEGSGEAAQVPGAFSDRSAEFAAFARSASRQAAKPPLTFSHAVLPHSPWRFLPSGQQYPAEDEFPGLGETRWIDDAAVIQQSWQRHLLQVGYLDRLLGNLMERLKRDGKYDEALIVVVADHGVSFRPGDRRRPVTESNFADIAGVPLLIKPPGQTRGRVDDRAARTTNLLPTMVDILGGRAADDFEGESLLDPTAADANEIEVSNSDIDGSVSMDFRDFVRQRDALVQDQAQLLGEDTVESVYRMGPGASEAGRRVASLTVSDAPGGDAEIEDAAAFGGVDPDGALVPVQVSGRLGGITVEGPLAVAVNGRLVSSAGTYELEGEARFSGFVPPSVLREGTNKVEVFAPTSDGLALLAETTGAEYRLAVEGGRTTIEGPGGARIRTTPGSVEGAVDALKTEEGVASLRGWAATRKPEQGGADVVLAFTGKRLLFAGPPNFEREDLANGYLIDRFGEDVGEAGFLYQVSMELLSGESAEDRVRFFAIADGRASELTPVDDVAAALEEARPRPTGYALVSDEGLAIEQPDGSLAHVRRGAVEGFVDQAVAGEGTLALRGWAATRKPREAPAENIVGFAGERLLFVSPPNLVRADLEIPYLLQRFGDDVPAAGFRYLVSDALLPESPADDPLQVFAVAGDRASELELVNGVDEAFVQATTNR